MSEEKLHRKRAYSRMVIRKAFLEMLEKMPINKITVKDVCELADVNRTTFYANFEDTYALLGEIKSELFNTIKAYLENLEQSKKPRETLPELFRAIYENRDACKVLLSLRDDDFIHRILYFQYANSLAEWERANSGESRERFDYYFEYQASGCVGMIRRWIAGGFAEPYQAMAEYAISFTRIGETQ